MRIRSTIAGAAFALAAIMGAATLAPAWAAPQMLGLVATAAPAPLTCEGGVCQAELSAFCLQRERDMPVPGTAYAPVDPAMITLVARMPDGRIIRRPAGALVRLAAARAQFAVTLSVPEELRISMGAESLAVEISPLASAAPVPVAGDPDPLSDGEIAAASGPMREIAGDLVLTAGPNAVAAKITNRMINVLALDPTRTDGLWQRAVGDTYARNSFDSGVKRASDYYKLCHTMPDAAEFKRCLQYAHDGYMGRINIEIWDLIGGGS